jgi:hypothetical protein
MLLLAASCRRTSLCPKGMQVVAGRSVSGESIWCKSPDGRTAQWIEFKDGARRQVCEYRAGQPDGPFLGLHPTGTHWIEGQFRDGAKSGAWHQWDKTGSLVAEGEYRGGRLIQGAPVAMAAKCEEMKP